MRYPLLAALLLLATGTAFSSEPAQRTLTFEDRVKAQEAVERVYYSHQVGATKPFGEAVPRAVIEKKVRDYLAESVALGKIWGRAVTGEALERELQRMARESRLPDRLGELFQALGRDSFLIQECLVRPVLVDRLARGAFAFDPAIHAGARRQAEETYSELVAHRIDPAAVHARRRVHRLVENDRDGAARHDDPSRVELSKADFARWRAIAPARVGEIGAIVERPDSFLIQVVLDESPGAATIASYVFEKRSWSDWLSAAAPGIDAASLHAVATAQVELPTPSTLTSGACAPDTWTFRGRPTERTNHVGVWTGSVMVIWGGEDAYANSYPITGGRYDPVTDTWTPTSTVNAPAGRSYASVVWSGTQMIVWGGYGMAGRYLDTGGRYDPVADSWSPMSTTNAPSARLGAVSVWTGTRMIVWGGADYDFTLSSGGRYDPATDTWTPTTGTSAPAPSIGGSAVWTGSRMIVWGGSDGYDSATGSRYDPVADEWSATTTNGAPSARRDHTAVWTGSRMLVWGGNDDNNDVFGDGAAYDPATDTWSTMSASGAPTARANASAVWTGSRMVVWSGYDPTVTPLPTTGGRYDPTTNTWAPTSTIGTPIGRYGNTTVWTGSQMLMWGGTDGGNRPLLGDGGRYDPVADTWITLAATGAPSARQQHSAVWTGSLMIVWGGNAFLENYANTGGRFDPATSSWTPTTTVGAPAGRYSHSAFWTGNVMIVWEGWMSGGSGARGARYDPVADTWLPISTTGAPPPAIYPGSTSAVWTGNRMIVWGGRDTSATNMQTGGRYDPVADSWTPTTTAGAPSARGYHTALWTGSRMIVWGGHAGTTTSPIYVNTGGRYDPVAEAWSPTSTTNAPPPTDRAPAVWVDPVMVIWAGSAGSRRYDPVADAWASVSTLNAPPSAVSSGTAVSTGSLMLVWGGYPATTLGGRYDPISDTWTPTSTAGAPLGRYSHSAVWTGHSMIVWGGNDGYGIGYRKLDSDGEYIADSSGAAVCNDGNACTDDACAGVAGCAHTNNTAACDDGNPCTIGDECGGGVCNGGTPLTAPPETENGAVAADKATYSWSPAANATQYDVVRGSTDSFPVGPGGADEVCFDNLAGATVNDPTAPAPGAGFWYLSRGENACGIGTFGTQSGGSPRTTTCP